MPIGNLPPKVFISYSHDDREFVRRLADDLMRRSISVWWDEWEIGVGDSLIDKVESGITSSSYLAIVLSPSSVSSAWVREELNAALIRQLRERRVFVLPILIEDCEIPVLLQDKRYADFREDYTSGLVDLLKKIEPPDTRTHGEGESFKYHHDYAIEWGFLDDRYGMRLFVSSHSQEFPHSVTCTISMVANKRLTQRMNQLVEEGFDWAADILYSLIMRDGLSNIDGLILIEGDTVAIQRGEVIDPKIEFGSEFEVSARRLGPDPGQDLIYEWNSVVDFALEQHINGIREAITVEQGREYAEWLRSNPI
jgi:hypothetical protein